MNAKSDNSGVSLPFIFNGDVAAGSVADMLNELSGQVGAPERFVGSFITPDLAKVRECFKHNCTLTGTLIISSAEGGKFSKIEIPVLYPYHGVFVTGNGNGRFERAAKARLMVWRPCLVRRPGIWFLRRFKNGGATEKVIEIGLLDQAVLSTKDGAGRRGMWAKNGWVLHQRRYYDLPRNYTLESPPQFIMDLYGDLWGLARSELTATHVPAVYALMDSGLQAATDNESLFYDSEDLETKRLFTYSVFLVEKIVRLICNKWLGKESVPDADYWRNCDGAEVGSLIRSALSAADKYAWLQPMEQRNAVDVVSCLTAISRFGGSGRSARYGAADRQNHPSFRDVICPVHTPESEQVGLTLHLALGADADKEGRLSARGGTGLGYAASLIPFYSYNDSARSMMGAKNYEQALCLQNSEEPLVTTGHEKEMEVCLKPLLDCDLLPGDRSFISPGRNLIVAYMPWYGLNYNDAIVANADLADMLAFTKTSHFKCYLQPGEQVDKAAPAEGSEVKEKQDLVRLKGGPFPRRIVCRQSGKLVRFVFHEPPKPEYGGMIEWEVSSLHRLGVGDKLTGRHGNKGVVSVMLPPEQMPRLPDGIGELSGKPVDLILNPLGVISRMNAGQLLESHAGLLLKLGVRLPVGTGSSFRGFDPCAVQRLFEEASREHGNIIDHRGRVLLKWADRSAGGTVEKPVVVGVQYFVRLDQMPSDKACFRGGKNRSGGYSPVTGQALRGRFLDGGQRLGEMEMWALSAYQADKLMRHFLTDTCPPPEAGGSASIRSGASQTFSAVCDGLFALGINLQNTGQGEYIFTSVDDAMVEKKGKDVTGLTEKGAMIPAVCGDFVCSKCKAKNRETAGSFNDVYGSRTGQRGKEHLACVADLLRDKGVRIAAADYSMEIVLSLCDIDIAPGLADSSAPIKLTIEAVNSIAPSKRKSIHLRISMGDKEYHAYDVQDTTKQLTLGAVLLLPLTCVKHKSERLQCPDPERSVPVKKFGGMADWNVFNNDTYDWGFIKLPFTVDPATDKINSRIGTKPFSTVAVLPWCYRRGMTGEDGKEMQDRLTQCYTELVSSVNKYDSKNNDKQEVIGALKKLFGELEVMMAGKGGMIRRDGLGRRVDNSGRFVVVPDPELSWDECGVPLEMLLKMFPKDRELVEKIRARASKIEISRYLRKAGHLVLILRFPSLHRYNVKALKPVVLGGAKTEWHDIVEELRALKSGDEVADGEYVISVNPLICNSMACDFDGDTISIFTVQEDEREDAERLLPTAESNLLSIATGLPVAEFDQDMVLGSYLIMHDDRLRKEFASAVMFNDCSDCSAFIERQEWDSDVFAQMQVHLIKGHKREEVLPRIELWMRKAFNEVTRQGFSFGFFDLLACRKKKSDSLAALIRNFIASENISAQTISDLNQELDSAAATILKKISENGRCKPECGVAAMVLSGARGLKPIRQMITARGYLEPGETCFDPSPSDFMFSGVLLDGMDSEQSFYAAMNGRSSMVSKKLSTADAGALTRRLVTACWRWTVEEGDCGCTAPRSPASCLWVERKRICNECYGRLTGGSMAPNGYPAGLIAAQSIGERGTQLSMRAFHTGTREANIKSVTKSLSDPLSFTGVDSFSQFRADLMIGPYSTLTQHHVDLLWTIIAASEKKTLISAERDENRSNVFSALAGGSQRESIKKLLEEKALLSAGPVRKILIGYQAETLHAAGATEPSSFGLNEYLYDDSVIRGLPGLEPGFDFHSDDDSVIRGLPGLEPEFDFYSDDDEPDEQDPVPLEGSPSSSPVAIIFWHDSGSIATGYRIETGSRVQLDSGIVVLARSLAAWLVNKHVCGSGLETPVFNSQADAAAHLHDSNGHNISKDLLSKYLSRIVLYWPDRCLCAQSLVR